MQIRITINTDGDAFSEPNFSGEVLRVAERAACDALRMAKSSALDSESVLFDELGNRCGFVRIMSDPEPESGFDPELERSEWPSLEKLAEAKRDREREADARGITVAQLIEQMKSDSPELSNCLRRICKRLSGGKS